MKIQTINITDVTLDYGGNHNYKKNWLTKTV